MKCYICNSLTKIKCHKCDQGVCRFHSNTLHDDEVKKFVVLCGSCYTQHMRDQK